MSGDDTDFGRREQCGLVTHSMRKRALHMKTPPAHKRQSLHIKVKLAVGVVAGPLAWVLYIGGHGSKMLRDVLVHGRQSAVRMVSK